ncbi:hypothetical protein VISI1226_07143 [Vibrio sinaloensis DSM 21326]|uniref:TadE-like domain-containing protein n=1 Tax=Vibrio sinaloensis DSM 21326 TaxID=945550 RepID=E8MAB3_PHOS4|nr:TadE family protein [Vibrio sinaloensis]EGA69062.1 hypothetical protein VISI1226_07143 [Vibrio sinaloensis DSM 21326]
MRSRKRQQGLAAVELVIGLPVIMLLLLSVTEIARMFVDMNTLTKAVRVGARYAMTQSDAAGCGPIMLAQNDVKQLVVYGTLNSGTEPLLSSLSTSDISVACENNLFVTVSASITFSPAIGDKLPGTELSLAVPLNASSVMRINQ